MRVRFILDTLNNSDPERECDPFIVFQRLNVAIQDAKDREPALSERCNLTYFDMPLTTNMLQAYWIDYEVWFRRVLGMALPELGGTLSRYASVHTTQRRPAT